MNDASRDAWENVLRQDAWVCPNCSRLWQPPVLLEAGRTEPYFTRYYCTRRCGFVIKIRRPRQPASRAANRLPPTARAMFAAVEKLKIVLVYDYTSQRWRDQ